MGIVAKPITFLDGNVLLGADLNSDFDTLFNEFNGNIDDDNIKVAANIDGSKLLAASIPGSKLQDTAITEAKQDYTSLKVVRAGPNHPGGNGMRLARATKAFTYVAGVVTVVVTFATDCLDGNPAFSAAPVCSLSIEHTGGASQHTAKITVKLASSITVEIRSTSGADVSSGTLHVLAMGPV